MQVAPVPRAPIEAEPFASDCKVNVPELLAIDDMTPVGLIAEVEPKLKVPVLVIAALEPFKVMVHAEFDVPALKVPELVIDNGVPPIVIFDAKSAVNVPELLIQILRARGFPLAIIVDPRRCITAVERESTILELAPVKVKAELLSVKVPPMFFIKEFGPLSVNVDVVAVNVPLLVIPTRAGFPVPNKLNVVDVEVIVPLFISEAFFPTFMLPPEKVSVPPFVKDVPVLGSPRVIAAAVEKVLPLLIIRLPVKFNVTDEFKVTVGVVVPLPTIVVIVTVTESPPPKLTVPLVTKMLLGNNFEEVVPFMLLVPLATVNAPLTVRVKSPIVSVTFVRPPPMVSVAQVEFALTVGCEPV